MWNGSGYEGSNKDIEVAAHNRGVAEAAKSGAFERYLLAALQGHMAYHGYLPHDPVDFASKVKSFMLATRSFG